MTDPFNILAAEYRPMVLAYLRAMVRDAHLAEDLTQETMIAAHESLDGFKPGGTFGSWLRGIARNKALMHWRSEKRHRLRGILPSHRRQIRFTQDKPHYAPWSTVSQEQLKTGTNTIAVYSNVAYDESTKAPYGQVDCLIEGLKLSDLN
jgi:RNA polymerase sigma factor (sigma-70 family)